MKTDHLSEIMYALTIADRPNNRHKWLARGFSRINTKPRALFSYWEKRLGTATPEDEALYNSVLFKYKKDLETRKETAESPGLATMLKTSANAAAKWIRSGMEVASESIIKERLETCKGCELWDSEALNGTGRCKQCGCSTWAKLRLPTEKCPIDKWGVAT